MCSGRTETKLVINLYKLGMKRLDVKKYGNNITTMA